MSKVYTLDGDILELNNFNKIFRKMTNSQTEINIIMNQIQIWILLNLKN